MKFVKQHRVAAFFILALLALFHLKNVHADTFYVGPGETYTTISAAVTAASAGDTIIVRDGTYGGSIIFVDKSLVIRAENQHQAMLSGSGWAIYGLMADSITIEGFTFNGSGRCGININQAGSSGTGSGGHFIRNNYFTSRGAVGCSDDYNTYSNITITGNTWENSNPEDPPLTVRGGGHTIESNTFNNCGDGLVITDGTGDPVTVRNNQITNNTGDGVSIMGAAILQENTIESNSENGVHIPADATNSTVSLINNQISNNSVHGVFVEMEATLRGNTIENNDFDGIYILDTWGLGQAGAPDLGQDSESEAGNNVIRNNTLNNVNNQSPNTISAYRNYWGLTNANDIDATIFDDDEDVSKGPVNFDPFLTADPTAAVEQVLTEAIIPKTTELSPAYPNPFNPETRIFYTLSQDAEVTLKVVDLTGRTVQMIVSGRRQVAGSYSTYWNGKTDADQVAPSGMYLLILNAGSVVKTQKVMLVR